MVWRAGTDAKCDWFNDTWLEFTGRTLEQERGDGWTEGIHPADIDRCLPRYLASFADRQPFEIEYRLRRRDGAYRWVLDRGVPFYDDGGAFAGFLGSCIDVDEHKRLDDSRARFLTAIAHEMRTPLTPMAAYVHQLERLAKRKSAVPEDLVKRLSRQLQRITHLVNDLSDASRLDSCASLTLQRENVNLSALVRDVIEEQTKVFARMHAERARAAIALRLPEHDVFAVVDAERISQAVRHVFSNALKFCAATAPISVELTGGECIELKVIDRGIGIPEAELEHVGKLYFRASNAPVANYPGVGLGLAATRQILENHGGALRVQSTLAGGTSVTLSFPREQSR